MARSRLGVLLMALTVAAVVGCHTITEEAPTEPSPVGAVAPITIPVILGTSPTGTPNPTPAPAPTAGPFPGPAPTPTPDPGTEPTPPPPPPTGGSCRLPPGSPDYSCSRTGSAFIGDVTDAIDRAIQKDSSLVDRNDKVCPDCYRVLRLNRFTSAVVGELQAAGFCALYDGEELAVKNTNTFNEQFDILVSSGYIRRGDGSYRSTCTPAWF